MQPILIVKLIVLLSIANGSPVFAKKIFGGRFSWPVDGGCAFVDGRPLFGSAKTIRGVLFSVVLATAAAPLLGLEAANGALVGSMAMAGDLFSSFVKRRLNFPPSSRAMGLDQIPESLFPLLAWRAWLPLGTIDILICVSVFLVGQVVLSPILYRIGVRDQPF